VTLPCIRCGKKLESAIPHHVRDDMPDWQPENQPSRGTTFIARGQYGSTVFDPQGLRYAAGTEFLEINVCDECMVALAHTGRVLHGVTPHPLLPDYEPWTLPGKKWCARCERPVGLSHYRHDSEPPF
jgi:hypothetical protein